MNVFFEMNFLGHIKCISKKFSKTIFFVLFSFLFCDGDGSTVVKMVVVWVMEYNNKEIDKTM